MVLARPVPAANTATELGHEGPGHGILSGA